ncbi:MAG: carboxypeptidase-like regulatory domain-containing protein [Chitinophagales bacterium]|nr:carboxypeptidase-like regulatory domain-containing protein [Chitinophagales bacterium]
MSNPRFGLRMLRIPALFIFLFICLYSNAQQTAIVTGKITDSAGEPIPGVNIKIPGFPKIGDATNEDGVYRIEAPAEKEISIIFSSVSYDSDTQIVTLKTGEVLELNRKLNIGLSIIPLVEVTDESIRDEASGVMIDAQAIERIPTPFGGFEAALASQALGVASTNELSSTYSVRGGNYDENLVYVNDFEVMRPFLIRSGQQEGLSFINPDLVSNAFFSSGGFQPKYGDKLSSVLDVQYKRPKEFHGSLELGLLGGSFHLEGADKKDKFTYLIGVRQKSSQYLLKSLEIEGQYSPAFTDVQSFFTYKVNDKVDLEWISNFAMNKFVFKPVSRETTFGVVNNVLRLTVYFDGKEEDSYRTFMTGFGVNQKLNRHLGFKWLASVYRSVETEAFDILGEYWIDEVETDFSDDNFGQTRYSLGVGGVHDYVRNDLETTVSSAGYKGYFIEGTHTLRWGTNYQYEMIEDRLNEWERLDSAGYSIPYGDDEAVVLGYVLKSNIDLQSSRINAYVQDTWTINADKGMNLTYGARITWWSINKEWVVSPRIQFSYHPKNLKSDLVFRAAAGLYNQPPFYREMRDLEGNVNTDLKAQKSFHAVAGIDLNFKAWNRKFKFVTELYYKYLYDIVPFEYDNVLIRYFGENKAHGYAAGIDFRLHGELVEGAESWISMSIMSTQEDIEGDQYFQYFDSTGSQVFPSSGNSDAIVDTNTVYPGFIPRPTDQRVRFNLFFQDYLPKLETFKVHLNLVFATGLPFGPPDKERYRDVLRSPFYRRVDIGFSALLFDINRKEVKPKSFMKHFESIWATFEVYNLLGVNNVVSYVWVKDISNTIYAVPNYLTNRRVNLRIIFKF